MNLPANAGDMGSIPRLGRSPGEGNGNPLQYSFLENPMDRGAWQTTEHGVAKSWTWQSNWVHTHIYTHTPCKKLLFLLDYSTDAHIVSSWITALMRVCTHTQHPPQETPFLTGLQHWCTHHFFLDYGTDARVHTHTAPPTRNPFSYWITALMQLFLSVASAQHPVKLSRSSFPPLSLQ